MVKQENIIKPLIFLDIFDYPPTAMELWRFLGVRAELGEVVGAADNFSLCHPESRGFGMKDLNLLKRNDGFVLDKACYAREGLDPSRGAQDDKITHPGCEAQPPLQGGEYSGFYFLPEREGLVEKRREFFHLSEKKFRIAKRAARLLHFIPTIKMIAVCNNFYYREQSDIDFFIIVAANRLWITRFFATIILDIFGLRARGEKTADKVCLSFYLSEDNLSLEGIVLAEETDPSSRSLGTQDDKTKKADKVDDPYLAYWLAFLEPIYGEDCYQKFWEANAWLLNIFPNAWPKIPVSRRCVGSIPSQSAARDCDAAKKTTPKPLPSASSGQALEKEGGILGYWLEKIAKKIQWQKISPHVKEMAALGDSRVVINKAMLKFHENDRREYYRDEFRRRLKDF